MSTLSPNLGALMQYRSSTILVGGIAAVAFAQLASAADLPRKAPPAPPPPPPLSWTGFYVGVNAGGNWGTSDPSTTVLPNAKPTGGIFFDGCINAASLCTIDQSMVSSAGSQS